MGAPTWTDAQAEQLKTLWHSNKSAREIAEAMGPGFTRGGILGKAHRMKLPAKAPRVTDPRVIEARKKKDKERHRVFRLKSSIPFVEPQVVQMIDPLNRSFADVGRFDCRWITNEDMTAPLFCAHPVVEDKSWCPHHVQVVTRGRDHATEDGRARQRFFGARATTPTARALDNAGEAKLLDEEAA